MAWLNNEVTAELGYESNLLDWFSGLQIHMWKSLVCQRSAESREFSPGAPISSHRESWQGGLG